MAPTKPSAQRSSKTRKTNTRRTGGYKKTICACPCGAEVAYSTQKRHRDVQAKLAALKAARELQDRVLAQNRAEVAEGARAERPTLGKRTHSEVSSDSSKRARASPGEAIAPPEFSNLPDGAPPLQFDSGLPETSGVGAPRDEDHLDAQTSARQLIRISRDQQVIHRRWGNISLLVRVDKDESDDDSQQEDDLHEDDSQEPYLQDDCVEDDDNDDDDDDDESRAENIVDLFSWCNEGYMRQLHALDGKSLNDSDLSSLRQFTLKVEDHITDRTFQRFERAFPNEYHTSLKLIKKRVELLSGLQPVRYSCCINSCLCYSGPFEDLTKCPKCGEARYGPNGKPRKYFVYHPIIPRLLAMVGNPERAEEMLYRSRAETHRKPGVIRDIFDSSYYRSLLEKIVPSEGGIPSYFFSDERDIALGFSTDGFSPFKRRDKTCWPLVLFNYNLSPVIRFKRTNTLTIGVVPGPHKPWDMDSYLWPLVQELNELQAGVKAFDAISQSFFQLHAYLILAFGDIPAMALIMRMKGTNGISPCRTCSITGIGVKPANSKRPGTLYVPLRRDRLPNANPREYDPSNLPMRTNEQFMRQAEAVEMASTVKDHEKYSKQYGIKGIPILSLLLSISFPHSFPFDFMHLIFECLLPNLIAFWTGSFKGIDHTGKGYVFAEGVWEEIGVITGASNSTIPSAFGSIPNVSKKLIFMTAEMMMNWMIFIAPIVLRGRFPQDRYYFHFLRLVNLVNLCLAFKIDAEMLDEIEQGFISWVKDYERFYYENNPARLAACPLALHALLHIAWGIRVAGPVWAYWAFPMERECGYLLRAIKSRRHPYASMTTHITATAHLDQIRFKFKLLDELSLDPDVRHLNKTTCEDYPDHILSTPKGRRVLPPDMCEKVYAALATRFNVKIAVVKAKIKLDEPIEHYGRVTCDSGDTIIAQDLVQRSEDTRDSSFVKYILLTDKYARSKKREPEFVATTFFGQLKRVITLHLPVIPQLKLEKPSTILLAIVRKVDAKLANGMYSYKQLSPVEAVDLSTLACVVGRVHDRGRWGIVDRSGTVVLEIV